MNRTSAILAGIIVLLVIGGLITYIVQTNQPSNTATSTPAASTDSVASTPASDAGQQAQSTLPVATTESNVGVTDNTAVVSGKVSPNGASTSYWYEYGATTALGSKTTIQTVGSGFVTIPTPGYITGLTRNTTYYFRLVAENQFGKVAGTTYSFHTTQDKPAPVGGVPDIKTLAASSITPSTAKLNGQVNPNKASTNYWFEYGRDKDFSNSSGFASVGAGGTNIPAGIVVSNLAAGATYYYRLDAQNQFGTVNGETLSFKTTGPSVASTPSAVTRSVLNVGGTVATFRAYVTPNGADTTYWYEYSTDSLLLGSTVPDTTSHDGIGSGSGQLALTYDVSNLSRNTTYYVRVVAQNSRGIVRGEQITFKTNK